MPKTQKESKRLYNYDLDTSFTFVDFLKDSIVQMTVRFGHKVYALWLKTRTQSISGH